MKKIFEKLFPTKKTQRKDNKKALLPDTKIATCALLLEMARVDGEFSTDEEELIIDMMKRKFGISKAEVDKIIEAANMQIDGSIDYWHFTNVINQQYNREEKKKIIKMVWQLIYADKKLDKYEDYLVHKLGDLLKLSHQELIEMKLKAQKE